MANNKCFKTKVGGQAVMEGVMMRGGEKSCLAVRQPDGEIFTEISDNKHYAWQKIPFVRGVGNMIVSMMTGYKFLMKSAEISMSEEVLQPDKFDLWLQKHFGEKSASVVTAIAGVLGAVLALVLFMYLPALAVKGLNLLVPIGFGKAIIEGIIKIAIFVIYLALVSRMKEIKRLFSYHGAEHKTIACYEAGEELTPENARKFTRFHPRCGTSFLLIVLVLSILISSMLPWGSALLRTVYKLLLLPIVMGISYELLQLCGKYDNVVTKIIRAPGLWLQRLTTNEPDDAMLEVAIAAVIPVLPQNPEEATW